MVELMMLSIDMNLYSMSFVLAIQDITESPQFCK